MSSPEHRVIIIRAWRDPGGIRVRLLADGPPSRQWLLGSVAETRAVLTALLGELTPGRPADPADTADRAGTVDGMQPADAAETED
jgi:hypothetical protein